MLPVDDGGASFPLLQELRSRSLPPAPYRRNSISELLTQFRVQSLVVPEDELPLCCSAKSLCSITDHGSWADLQQAQLDMLPLAAQPACHVVAEGGSLSLGLKRLSLVADCRPPSKLLPFTVPRQDAQDAAPTSGCASVQLETSSSSASLVSSDPDAPGTPRARSPTIPNPFRDAVLAAAAAECLELPSRVVEEDDDDSSEAEDEDQQLAQQPERAAAAHATRECETQMYVPPHRQRACAWPASVPEVIGTDSGCFWEDVPTSLQQQL